VGSLGEKGTRVTGQTIILRSSLCLHRGYASWAHYLVYVTKTSARAFVPAAIQKITKK